MTLTQKLGLRFVAIIFSLVFMATAVHAEADFLDLRISRVLFDATCTDTEDTPATTVNVDVSTLSNWDSLAEMINPDRNKRDAVQTSGSADGWCDAKPWIIKGSWTAASDRNLFIGPILLPNTGFYTLIDFTTIATDWAWLWQIRSDVDALSNFTIGTLGSSTAVVPLLHYIGPMVESSSAIASVRIPIPTGVRNHLILDLDGAGTWLVDTMFFTPKDVGTN